ncbi:unnamed protein product [Heterobilharzia americana]|nr:unnamed protein product [Heterobilharzia americana]
MLILKKQEDEPLKNLECSVIQRNQLAIYICDCLSFLPNNLPSSFSEFFQSFDLKCVYVKMLKTTCTLLCEVLLHSQFVIMVGQQMIQFLENEQSSPVSTLRSDLLKILLHLLMNSESNTQVQISPANRLETHCAEFQITAVELDIILGIGALVNICARNMSLPHEFADSFEGLIFMKPETMLGILNHDSVTSGSRFIETSVLICLLESFYGPLPHLLWPDIDSNENFYCELFMCLNDGIIDVTQRFSQQLSIEVYGCLISHVCANTKKQSLINLFLINNPWGDIILEHLQTDTAGDNVLNLTTPFLDFINALLSAKSPAIFSVISKCRLQKLLLTYMHDAHLCTPVIKNCLRNMCEKIGCCDFEFLDDRDRFSLEVMVASDNVLPPVYLSQRFKLFYQEVFYI